MEYYNGVYQALALGKPLPVTVDEGIQTMRVIDAARKSNAEKRVVELKIV
jgi:scyllo-inositol 2-dehydrogenase (NADP+)